MKPISGIPPECMYSMKFFLSKSLEGKIGQIFSRKTTKHQLQKEDPYRFSVADTQTNSQPSARCTKQKSHKQTQTQKRIRFRNKSTRRRRKKGKTSRKNSSITKELRSTAACRDDLRMSLPRRWNPVRRRRLDA
jgi:hypothetical protein